MIFSCVFGQNPWSVIVASSALRPPKTDDLLDALKVDCVALEVLKLVFVVDIVAIQIEIAEPDCWQ